jgi:hypothetical protein
MIKISTEPNKSQQIIRQAEILLYEANFTIKPFSLTMKSEQTLYYAIGEFAYSITPLETPNNKMVQEKLREILMASFQKTVIDFDPSEIISYILNQERMDVMTAYLWATNELQRHLNEMPPQTKEYFTSLLSKVIIAFPNIHSEDLLLVQNFTHDLNA